MPEPTCGLDDLRCFCGRLIARRTPEGIELVCTRCKRALLLDPSTDPPRLVPIDRRSDR